MASRMQENDGSSPAKIFVGGLPRETTMDTFTKHFGKYGTIVDIVIMKDRETQKPRGFGFVTYEDPSAVDQVIEDTHVIDGKTVEIKRTIPKGAAPVKDFKTKKIFVGGIPTALTVDEFKDFFSQFGEVVDQEIIRDHSTNRSRGFGFIVFEKEKTVDELLAKKGNKIVLAGTQVEIKKAEPKRHSNPSPYSSEPRNRHFADSSGNFGGSYSVMGSDRGSGPSSYRTPDLGSRPGGYGSYGGVVGEYGGGYGTYGNGLGDNPGKTSFGYSGRSSYGNGLGDDPGETSFGYSGRSRYGNSLGDNPGETSFGYSSRWGSYSGGFGGGYGTSGFGGYGRGGSGYGGDYDSLGADYGSGGLHGSRGGGYGGSAGRYHPYGR